MEPGDTGIDFQEKKLAVCRRKEFRASALLRGVRAETGL